MPGFVCRWGGHGARTRRYTEVEPFFKQIWLFEQLTPNGASGAPSKAAAEKARVMAHEVVNDIANDINELRVNAGEIKHTLAWANNPKTSR